MYTKNELKVAKFLGVNPNHIKGYEDDPELKDFVMDLITLRRNNDIINKAMLSSPFPLDDKTPEEVLREVRQEVWDSLTFGRLQGETLRLRAKTS